MHDFDVVCSSSGRRNRRLCSYSACSTLDAIRKVTVNSGSVDVLDEKGQNLLLFYFVRESASTFNETSIITITDVNGKLKTCYIYTGTAKTGAYTGAMLTPTGLEIWGTQPHIDFKTDYATDFDVRFEKDTSHNLNVYTPDLNLIFGHNGHFRVGNAGKGIILTNAGGDITKIVRLNNTGDGLIYENYP